MSGEGICFKRNQEYVCFSEEAAHWSPKVPPEINGYSEGSLSKFPNFRVVRDYDFIISKSVNECVSLFHLKLALWLHKWGNKMQIC